MPVWTQPRVAPPQLLPAAAGGFVVLLALPVVLLAGWSVAGWGIGAVMWVGFEGLGWFLARLRAQTGNLAAAGVSGFLMLFRAVAVMAVVVVLVTSNQGLGLVALLTYAVGYTAQFGLALVGYYTGPEAGKVIQ